MNGKLNVLFAFFLTVCLSFLEFIKLTVMREASFPSTQKFIEMKVRRKVVESTKTKERKKKEMEKDIGNKREIRGGDRNT